MKRLMLAVAIGAACVTGISQASSHREAPNISRLPTVDATDLYMFNSYEPGRQDYVTVVANYLPLQAAYGGPNYFALDPNALYEIHFDANGDAREDLTFQFRFQQALAGGTGIALDIGGQSVAIPLKNAGVVDASAAALNFRESFSMNVVRGLRRSGTVQAVTNAQTGASSFSKPFDNVGSKSIPNYADYAGQFVHSITIPGCSAPGKVFVGQRREGFAVNLGKVFDLVNFVPVEGDSAPGANDGAGFPGGVTQSAANNKTAYANVTSLALELPKACVTAGGNGVVGAWTTASVRQARIVNPFATFAKPEVNGGAWTQVSRLGMPLVNEVVIGLKDKDRFNSSEPKDDGQFATYVTNPSLPALLNLLFRDAVNSTLGANIPDLAPTNFPRNDLVTAFLTGFPGVNQMATVTGSEMLRLNTGVAAVAKDLQSNFGVAGGDIAGFPNGRRPGDDTVDIALRVVMGALCHELPIGADGAPVNLHLCGATDEAARAAASVGNVPFTDGAPQSAQDFDASFPYLRTPHSGTDQ